jgi:hypothetical protein
MRRILLLVGVLAAIPGCCTQQQQVLNPLPEGLILPYAELVDRAKKQVNLATEAFYVDDWPELKKAALGLEQTAKLFAKAPDTPKSLQAEVKKNSEELAKEALQLIKDAQAKDVLGANARLQTINLKIREFHTAPKK